MVVLFLINMVQLESHNFFKNPFYTSLTYLSINLFIYLLYICVSVSVNVYII